MSDRIRIPVQLATRPQGSRVLPVSPQDFEALARDASGLLDASGCAALANLAAHAGFSGEAKSTLWIPEGDGKALLLVGCGKGPGRKGLRHGLASAMGKLEGGAPWTLLLPDSFDAADAEAAIEGVSLACYAFGPRVASMRIPGDCHLITGAIDEAGLARVRARVEGMLLTRDLVNAPACDLNPEGLAAAAREVADRHGWEARTWVGDQLLDEGFHLVHAVGRASIHKPTMTVIEHRPGGVAPRIGIVGKGVVFDSGGLGIKPAGSMLLMRKDMGGAGTVIGALDALGRSGCATPFVAVIPSAENSIGADAFRPGDVINSHAGLKVEIGHTDAEGRLLLADGLSLARELGAPRLVDLATLTGAARVALGPDLPALFGDDEELVEAFLAAGQANEEPYWRMPLVEHYESFIDSPWADVNNSASERRGGAITAALFLRRFAQGTPWAHIDMYGWEDSGKGASPKGANGAGVRALADVVAGLG